MNELESQQTIERLDREVVRLKGIINRGMNDALLGSGVPAEHYRSLIAARKALIDTGMFPSDHVNMDGSDLALRIKELALTTDALKRERVRLTDIFRKGSPIVHYVVDVSITEVQEAVPAKTDKYGKIETAGKERKTKPLVHVVVNEEKLTDGIEHATAILGMTSARQKAESDAG